MAATVRSHTSGSAASAVNPAITLPGTISANDLMVIIAAWNAGATSATAQNGWTEYKQVQNAGAGRLWIGYKVANGTEDGTTQQPINLSTADIVRFVSVSITAGTYNPSNPMGAASDDATFDGGSGITCSSIALLNDPLVMMAAASFTNTRTHSSATAPLSKLNEAAGGVMRVSLWTATIAASTSGSKVVSFSGNTDSAASLFYIRSKVTHEASASLDGAAAITATGIRLAAPGASLSGAAVITATGIRLATPGASLAGDAQLTVDAIRIAAPGASLEGDAQLTVVGTLVASGSADLQGNAQLSVVGSVLLNAIASLQGSGALTAAGSKVEVGVATLLGEGVLTASGVRLAAPGASLVGDAQLLATGEAQYLASALLEGNAVLVGNGGFELLGEAALEGDAQLVAQQLLIHGGAAALIGEAILTAEAQGWTIIVRDTLSNEGLYTVNVERSRVVFKVLEDSRPHVAVFRHVRNGRGRHVVDTRTIPALFRVKVERDG